MARAIEDAPLTEPVMIDCHFIEGMNIEVRDEFLRIVGWVHLETTGDGQPERRIVARAAIPTSVVRALIRDLRKALAKGGH